MESNKQQIEEVRHKIQAENLETRAAPKLVKIRLMGSVSIAFSWQEDKNEEIKKLHSLDWSSFRSAAM